MEKKEKIMMKGKVNFLLKDENGKVLLDKTVENLILDGGLEIASERLGGTGTQDKLQCIALGTSNAAVVATQTDLQGSELGRVTTVNSFVSPDKERFIGEFTAGVGTGTIEEAVIADTNAASGSRKCFGRVLSSTIIKGATQTLTVTWEVQHARG